MAGREPGRFGTVSCAQLPANGWRLCGMAGREPGGFGAISRWLSEERATPPENGGIEFCIPEGCQPHPQSLRHEPKDGGTARFGRQAAPSTFAEASSFAKAPEDKTVDAERGPCGRPPRSLRFGDGLRESGSGPVSRPGWNRGLCMNLGRWPRFNRERRRDRRGHFLCHCCAIYFTE
jgi:hypothetical protein